jgi:putative ABC transport system substrate-binding protein
MAAPRLGLITYATEKDPLHASMMDQVAAGLARHGFVEPDGISLQRHHGERDKAHLAKTAADLALWKPDLIVSLMTNSDIAALEATAALGTPVLCWSMDPVDSGLLQSARRPGGRLTGVAFPPVLALLQLRALRILKPDARRIGYLHNSGYAPAAGALKKMRDAAQMLGMTLAVHEVNRLDALVPAIARMSHEGMQALVVGPHELFNLNGELIGQAALAHGLPAVAQQHSVARGGGVLSFVPDFPRLMETLAGMAARILQGADPAQMPVERHIMPLMMLNLSAAKSLGLDTTASLIDEADDLIDG